MFQVQVMPTIVPKTAGHLPEVKTSKQSAKRMPGLKDCGNAESEAVGKI